MAKRSLKDDNMEKVNGKDEMMKLGEMTWMDFEIKLVEYQVE